MLIPDKDGKVYTRKGKVKADGLDVNYPIKFSWHTHPYTFGNPWPSQNDPNIAKKNGIVDIMTIYIPRQRRAETVDDWALWIVDKDGKAHEYKVPGKPWPREE